MKRKNTREYLALTKYQFTFALVNISIMIFVYYIDDKY